MKTACFRILLFVAFALLPFFMQKAVACSMTVPPITKFDTEQYIFIGKVESVISAIQYRTKIEAWGLRIKVTDTVYSPRMNHTRYDVYPLRLTTWCGSEPMYNQEELNKLFPVGSEVRAVANTATLFWEQKNVIYKQVETSFLNKGSIARNDLKEEFRTSSSSIYDYRTFWSVLKKMFPDPQKTTKDDLALLMSISTLPEFELRKDLVRLKDAQSKEEKLKILERLKYYPNHRYGYNLDYQELVKNVKF